MSSVTPEPVGASTVAAASASTAANPGRLPTGLAVATVIVTVLAALGLVVTLGFLVLLAVSADTEDFGWFVAFSTVASVLNALAALAALVLGVVGAKRQSVIPRVAIVVGGLALLVLVAQLIFIAVA